VQSGTKITFENEGDESPGIIPADITFVLSQKPHPLYTREGNDLVMTHTLPLKDALCGGEVTVRTPDGRTVRVPLTEIVTPTSVKVVDGEGMPLSKSPSRRGDLRIRFKIEFPRSLSRDAKTQLRTLL
jgi:DnaJ family protein B protein 4